MKRTITLLLTLAGLSAIWAMAQARAVDKTPEFLQVKLGKTLAEQFTECPQRPRWLPLLRQGTRLHL